MPLIQTMQNSLPTPLLGLALVAVYVLLSVLGLIVVRRIFSTHRLKMHNDIADPLFTTMGAIYAVLLAFMVIITWQGFDGSHQNTAREANYLADLYRDATPLPDTFRSQLKTDLRNYVSMIIIEDWPAMARGERWSPKTEASQKKLWNLYTGFLPRSETEKIFFAESVRKLNSAGELRRQRLLDAGNGLNGILYFVLIAGGLVTISFTLFFGTENFGPQLLMTSMLAVMISLTLFTIMALDYPFTGDISIRPDMFRTVMVTLLH